MLIIYVRSDKNYSKLNNEDGFLSVHRQCYKFCVHLNKFYDVNSKLYNNKFN